MRPALRLFNTASLSVEEFKADGTVGMYCCGPTVYNYQHIGNMRTYIFEDILRRALKAAGFKVNHVVNITDVGHLTDDADSGDDKMEKGAEREGKTVWDIAQKYTNTFMQNIDALNIEHPEAFPRATDHIPEMIAMVQTLIDKGFTYTTDDGIYFDTAKFPDYVKFARLDPEQLMAGARIDMGEKHSNTDFALWKFSPKDKKRAMEWDSPWGVGFPGWHIECSAMSLKYLSQPLDIHCGGADHIRIHHTNEIAQVEAATGKKFCRHWLHGEWLVMEKGEKMSKSKGLFVTLDVLKKEGINPLAYRLYCFSAHYRSPLKFSWTGIESAAQSYASLKKQVASSAAKTDSDLSSTRIDEVLTAFWAAVNDDLNMPRALAAIWDMLKDGSITADEKRAALKIADTILALDLLKVEAADSVTEKISSGGSKVVFTGSKEFSDEHVTRVLSIVDARKAAKLEKNWAESDRLRDELVAMGVIAKDMKDGSTECVLK